MKKIFVRCIKYIARLFFYEGCVVSRSSSLNLRCRLRRVNIGDFARIAERADVRNLFIGSYSTIGRCSKITDAGIGKYCAIFWDCTINATAQLKKNNGHS